MASGSPVLGQAVEPSERAVRVAPFSRLYWPSPLAIATNAGLGTLQTVQRFPVPDMWTLSTVQSLFHSDNAYETEQNQRRSGGWIGSFAASFVPYSTRRWTPRLTLQGDLVRFFQEPGANYNSQSAVLSSWLALDRDQHWSWITAASLWRYAGAVGGGGEFYKYYGIDNGLAYQTAIPGRDDLWVAGSLLLRWRGTDPGYLSRLESGLGLAVVYAPCRTVTLSPYVRPAFYWYPNDSPSTPDRQDFNLAAGFVATWTPVKDLAVSASYGWTGNYSSAESRSYTEALPAITLGAAIGF